MGLNYINTKWLLHAKKNADFNNVVTIGRQGIYFPLSALDQLLNEFGYNDRKISISPTPSGLLFCEELLKHIGAGKIDSIDASDYEEATIIHDMNSPIGSDIKGQYSALLEFGTLEHVFNFPVAIKSCMEMVKVGGHFIGVTVANNYPGHGFYQFSPELIYRTFTEENGYKLNSVVLCFEGYKGETDWYEVKNPAEVDSRVIFLSKRQVSLCFIAERISDAEPFKQKYPQQFDYEMLVWKNPKLLSRQGMASRLKAFKSKLYFLNPFKSFLIDDSHFSKLNNF
jgi:hypothetical protein